MDEIVFITGGSILINNICSNITKLDSVLLATSSIYLLKYIVSPRFNIRDFYAITSLSLIAGMELAKLKKPRNINTYEI